MSDTPRTDSVMPESTNWHFPDSDEYTAQRKEMQKLERELAEACQQRDTLAEALRRYMRASEKVGHSPVAYPDEWRALCLAATEAEAALAAVKGGNGNG